MSNFIGESEVDAGGLTIEFFTLLMEQIASKYCIGKFLQNDNYSCCTRYFKKILTLFFLIMNLYRTRTTFTL